MADDAWIPGRRAQLADVLRFAAPAMTRREDGVGCGVGSPQRDVRPANRRVLVAENDATNQLVLKEMLRRLGYDCDVVGNGAEALAALRLRRYAAVLMACYMPEMDGFAATEELRAREQHDHAARTPVIAMTARAMAEDRDRCTQSGMDACVSKPVNVMALGAALGRCVAGEAVAAG